MEEPERRPPPPPPDAPSPPAASSATVWRAAGGGALARARPRSRPTTRGRGLPPTRPPCDGQAPATNQRYGKPQTPGLFQPIWSPSDPRLRRVGLDSGSGAVGRGRSGSLLTSSVTRLRVPHLFYIRVIQGGVFPFPRAPPPLRPGSVAAISPALRRLRRAAAGGCDPDAVVCRAAPRSLLGRVVSHATG